MHTVTSKFTNRETKQRHTAVNYSTVIRMKQFYQNVPYSKL